MSDLQGSRRAQNFAGQRHEASAPSSAVDLGVDVGGTFTDFVGFRGRDVVSLKLPSTRDPSEAVAEGLRALGAARMAHGTTVATNAILERKGARTAFVTTEGFEHLLLIGRQNRPSLYDLRITRPDPPIPRERCFGLRERVDAHGRVLHRPAAMVRSGPAGGVAAAVAIARTTGHRNLLTFDMGGTSADFSTIVRGSASWTAEAMIDEFPLALPVVDIESVGAGGGSIAWVDAGRALRVGPHSAGAEPGPIAYGKGGDQVTVSDADLSGGVLGSSLLGGRLPLRSALAARGIAHLAGEVHLSSEETILGVQRVVRATMAKAMRIILARRGLDPRDFALLAFGGAGPMHAWALARELRIPRVLVPLLPGVFSAYGILISPVQLEYSRTIVRPLDVAQSAIGGAVRAFRSRARQALREEHGDARRAVFQASVDLRYRGQSYEINIPLRGDLARAFRREHRRRYGYAARGAPIELVTVRLTVRLPRLVTLPRPPGGPVPKTSRRGVLFDDGWSNVPVFERESLPVGFHEGGPAIVAEAHATTVVPPGAGPTCRT